MSVIKIFRIKSRTKLMSAIKIFRTKSRTKISGFISGFALIFLLAWAILPVSAAGLEANRVISAEAVYPGESFAVTVHIKANHDVEALTLDEDLPDGWQASQSENNGAAFEGTSTFKASTLEWVWIENLSTGKERTVVYNVTVPSNSKPGNFTISGRVSAYSIPATPVEGLSGVIITSPLPNTEFSANPLHGAAPLTVQFTDLSAFNPDSWEWDFDGNGNIDSNEKNPVYTYENSGIYTVILNATKSTYGNTRTKTGYITVTEKSSSSEESEESKGGDENGGSEEDEESGGNEESGGSGGSGGNEESGGSEGNEESGGSGENEESGGSEGNEESGGSGGSGGSSGGRGGGGAGSPEPGRNVEVKEISNERVFKGTRTCFRFKGETNDIVTVEFDPKKSFGKTTAIVEMLKNTSSIVKEPAPGTVYRNVNVWVGNSGFSSPDNLENARINFRVSRAWITEQGVNKNTVTLYRYSQGSWNPLPTTPSREDEVYFYFIAETPGISPFAISSTEERIQSVEISPSKIGENQTSNEEKASDKGKQGIPASNMEKEEKKSSPGLEAVFIVAELLVLYAALKKKR